MPIIDDPTIVNDAATLSASAALTTASVQCFHARQVTFMLSATNAAVLAGAEVEVGTNLANWWGEATTPSRQDVGVIVTGTTEGVPLNTGEVPLCVNHPNGLLPVRFARLKLTAGGADNTGLKIRVVVVQDLSIGPDAAGGI